MEPQGSSMQISLKIKVGSVKKESQLQLEALV
jgi:hypothetical protein